MYQHNTSEDEVQRHKKSNQDFYCGTGCIFLIGLLILCMAVLFFLAQGAQPTCNGTIMKQGDLCRHTTNGTTTAVKGYDLELADQQSSSRNLSIGMFIASLVIFAFVVYSLYENFHNNKVWQRNQQKKNAPASKSEPL